MKQGGGLPEARHEPQLAVLSLTWTVPCVYGVKVSFCGRKDVITDDGAVLNSREMELRIKCSAPHSWPRGYSHPADIRPFF